MANKRNGSIQQKSILLVLLFFTLGTGESVLIRHDDSRTFAAGWQSSKSSFQNAKVGDEREIGGVKLRWCPPGRFVMGSPSNEPEHRPDEAQVEVRLTKGFWMGKYEVTQGQWKRIVGEFPQPQPAGEGGNFPVCWVNYAEAEDFCQKLTELGHKSGELPKDWEFRLPTEAQWEYACRAGTTTATSFGNKFTSKQANFNGGNRTTEQKMGQR